MKRLIVASVSVISLMFAGATGASASPAGNVSIDDVASSSSKPAQIDGKISPQLDPIVIAECNAGLGEVVIDTASSEEDGKVSLRCGDDKSGYVHIRKNHENDWEKRKGGAEGLWDDLMWYSTKSALENPSFTLDMGSNKRCYTAPIVIENSEGKKVTFHPTVLVSMNNKRVITSYPTTEHECVP